MKRKNHKFVIILLLLLDVIGGGIIIRYRHRIASEIDDIYRMYYTYRRNKDNQKIHDLHTLQDDTSEWYCTHKVIAHGGGGIDDKTCTNSLEAIDLAYANGTRMFDIDIQETSDGVLVCRHGWIDNIEQDSHFIASRGRSFQWDIEQLRYHIPIEYAKVPDLKTFMSIKAYHKYTPISFEDFLNFMVANQDVWLIADFGYIASNVYESAYKTLLLNLPQTVQDRIVVTFNAYDDAKRLRSINPKVKLQLKRYGMKEESYYDVAKFCTSENIHAVNLSLYNINDEGIALLRSKGINVFIAAVDFLSDYQYCIKQGANGIVSNFLYENDLKLIE